jgi:hypothetical protein
MFPARRARYCPGMEDMEMDPGLDRHVWESEWAQIRELLDDDPQEGLGAADDLIERMLVERGFPEDTVGREGVDVEITAELEEARRVTEAHDAGEEVGAADTIAAASAYQRLFDALMARGPVQAPLQSDGDVEI